MKKRLFYYLNILLLLSALFPISLNEATELSIDPSVELSAKTDEISKEDSKFSLEISYKHFSTTQSSALESMKTTQDSAFLKLDLPKGFSYAAADNPDIARKIKQEDQVLIIDLKDWTKASLELATSWSKMAETSTFQGEYYNSGHLIGQTTAYEVKKNTEVKMAPQEVAPQAENLDLGVVTTRQLPIVEINSSNKDNYTNISYHEVKDNASFLAAMNDVSQKNGTSNIIYMNVVASFVIAASGARPETTITKNSTRNYRQIVINGNNHCIDFRQRAFRLAGNKPWDVILQNVQLQSSNPWGPFNGWNTTARGTYTFHNVSHEGYQMFEGAKSRVILSGDVSSEMMPDGKYVSKPQPSYTHNISLPSGAYGGNQTNISCREIIVRAGANLTLKNPSRGGNLHAFNSGNLYFESNPDGSQTKVNCDNSVSGSAYPANWNGSNDYNCVPLSSATQDLSGTDGVWSSSEKPAELASLKNSIYMGDKVEVVVKNGKSRKTYSGAVQINESGSLILKDNSKLFIHIEEDQSAGTITESSIVGNSQIPIFFVDNGTLSVGKKSELELIVGKNLSDGGFNESRGPAIRSGAAANKLTIDIQEDAKFKVETSGVSVDTADNYTSIIQDGASANGSEIKIAKGATFDVGFNRKINASRQNPLISLNRGTLKIPGDDTTANHSISQWIRNNVEEDKPDFVFQPLEKTTISYAKSVVTPVTKISSGFIEGSPSMVEVFKNNFKTDKSAHRIKVESLKFEIRELGTVTNQKSSDGTYQVKGHAVPPGGKVSLSGGPFEESSLTAEQRQATIEADGSFTWSGALSRDFYWQEDITVNYVGQNNIAKSTKVIDVTKPEVVGKNLYIPKNAEMPEASAFVKSVVDANPEVTDPAEFTWAFAADSEIMPGVPGQVTNGDIIQNYTGKIIAKDKAGNQSEPVEVVLSVYHYEGALNKLVAEDATVEISSLTGILPNSPELEKYIIKAMQAQVLLDVNGELKNFTKDIVITNLAEIDPQMIDVHTVKFKLVATAENGLTNDLVKEDKKLTLISRLVKPDDPSQKFPPDDERENEGTGNGGEFTIDYVPSTFDFGQTKIKHEADQVLNAQSKQKQQWVQVTDERVAPDNQWHLSVRMPSEFQAPGKVELAGATITIPKGDTYNAATQNQKNPAGLIAKSVELSGNDTSQTIFSGDGINVKSASTNVWAPGDVTLKIPQGKGMAHRQYRAVIVWELKAGPSS